MNADAQYPYTYCYFYADGFAEDPDAISDLLRLTPSEVARKGEANRKGLPVQSNKWEIESPAPRNTPDFEGHLDALLTLLEPRRTEILSLSERSKIGIYCVGYYNYDPGFEISGDLIARLATLRLSKIGFDLYGHLADDARRA